MAELKLVDDKVMEEHQTENAFNAIMVLCGQCDKQQLPVTGWEMECLLKLWRGRIK